MARPEPGGPTVRSVYLRPWRIDIVAQPGVRSPVPFRVLARTAAQALTAAGAPHPASLTLVLSDDADLAALNAAHMGEDHPTDVLSFPMLQPSAFPAHAGKRPLETADLPREPGYVLSPGRRTHLGDIVISVEQAISQAEGWAPTDEIRQLVIHGVLHICGWDHADPEERDGMRKLERGVMGLS